MFAFTGQTVSPRAHFSAPVTGTPTAQLYVGGVATGAAVNGTGADRDWGYDVTYPALTEGQYIEVWAEATVSGSTEKQLLLQASAIEAVSDEDLANAGSDSRLLAILAGKSELTENGDGTQTLRVYAADGVTAKGDITYNAKGEKTQVVWL